MPPGVALVSTLITERALCVDCIAKAALLSREATETAFTVIRRTVDVHQADARRCRSCGELKTVYRLGSERPL